MTACINRKALDLTAKKNLLFKKKLDQHKIFLNKSEKLLNLIE